MKIIAIILLIPAAMIKAALVVIGWGAVWIKLQYNGNMRHGIYRIGQGRPHTYSEAAWRNPVGGLGWWIPHPKSYHMHGFVLEPHLTRKRFQARFNHSGLLCSLRLVWKYSDARYGEFYLGWKLGSIISPPELDFAMSLRLWAEVMK